MRLNKFVLTGLTALACLGTATQAHAGGRVPGSLLLFPEFDNRSANLTLLTVTNTNPGGGAPTNPSAEDGTVKVEFIYIGKFGHSSNGNPPPVLNCSEFNRTELLTANDTISLLTSAHNPNQEQGFVYAFAKHKTTNLPISFNFLIGNVLTLEGLDEIEYSMNPVAFNGIPGNTATSYGLTNIDSAVANGPGDTVRDLDGFEYEKVPGEILIPRFIGSGGHNGNSSGQFESELILIGLSGGRDFQTIVDFLIYNDNEEVFSAQFQFKCWDRVPIDQINGVFTQNFLKNNTNHALNEIVGAPDVEAGWIHIQGNSAFSSVEQISGSTPPAPAPQGPEPAIYAVLIERIGDFGAADLPFETGIPRGGDLFPVGINGDPLVNTDASSATVALTGTSNDNQ